MTIAAALLPEFDQEMARTRALLDRVPEDHFDFRPHEKSWTLIELATHVAQLLVWAKLTIERDAFDMAAPQERPPLPDSTAELVARLDAHAAEARAALEGADDATLMQEWSLRAGEHTIFSLPKAAVLRTFVLNHHIHHRGQLTVYLRQCGAKLPSTYGPTADAD